MKGLMRRELRRLLVFALALGGLGLLSVLFLATACLLFDRDPNHVDRAVLVVLFATPWILGVSAVAPEHESGAEAFLATLPISRRRVLAVRAGAALVMSIVVVASFCLLYELGKRAVLGDQAVSSVPTLAELSLALATGAGGLLASVVTRKTLVAFVTGPLFALAPWLLWRLLAWNLGAPQVFEVVALTTMFPVLVLAAAVVYLRTGPHQGLSRPLLLSGLVLGGALALGSGITTACYAVEQWTQRWFVLATRPGPTDSRYVAILLRPDSEWRNYELRTLVVDGQRPDEVWELEGHAPLAFSPDDTTLLTVGGDLEQRTWHLWDLQRREQIASGEAPRRPQTGPVALGSKKVNRLVCPRASLGRRLVWQGRTPFLVDRVRALKAWDGSEQIPLPKGTVRIEDWSGSRLILVDAEGARTLWDLDHPSTTLSVSEWLLPEWLEVLETRLGRGGKGLLVLGREPGGKGHEPKDSLWVIDTQRGKTRQIEVDLEARGKVEEGGSPRPKVVFQLGPRLDHMIFQVYGDRPRETWCVDLKTGRLTSLGPTTEGLVVVAWSPSGDRAAGTQTVWDVRRAASVDRDEDVAVGGLFLEEDRMLRVFPERIERQDLSTGDRETLDLD